MRHFPATHLLLLGLGVCLASDGSQAAPRVDHVFPAGGSCGQTTTITLSGDFPEWPVRIWTDRDGLEFTAAEKKGQLQLTVAPDAAPGVYWFRALDSQGASDLRPLVVGKVSETTEQEANDGPLDIPSVELPMTINGRLEKRGDVDVVAFSLQAGQTLVASLDAHRNLASPMDSVLQICDANGFVLAQNDDGRGLDPQIQYTAGKDGTHLVRLFAFPETPNSTIGFAGQANFVYRLTLTTGGFVHHALPLAIAADTATEVRLFGSNLNASETPISVVPPAHARSFVVHRAGYAGWLELPVTQHSLVVHPVSSDELPISQLPVIVSACLDKPRRVHTVRFPARQDQKLSFRVESRALGYPLDAVLQLQDLQGKSLAEADDKDKTRDPVLEHTFKNEGEFRVVIRDLHDRGGPRYAYRLTITEAVPDYALSLASGTFLVERDKSLEIPVTVTRKNGCAASITVSARGLPPGVSCTPVVSQGEGDSAKSVKLKFTASGDAGSGPFQVVGTLPGETERQHAARFEVAGGKRHHDAWITLRP